MGKKNKYVAFINPNKLFNQMKSWNQHSSEERRAVFEKLVAVYEKHGKPEKLKNPKSVEEIINILN